MVFLHKKGLLSLARGSPLAPLPWTGTLHGVNDHERDQHPDLSVTKLDQTWQVGVALCWPFLRYRVWFGLFLALWWKKALNYWQHEDIFLGSHCFSVIRFFLDTYLSLWKIYGENVNFLRYTVCMYVCMLNNIKRRKKLQSDTQIWDFLFLFCTKGVKNWQKKTTHTKILGFQKNLFMD